MSPIPADSLMVAPTAHTAPAHPLAELNSNCVADALRVDCLSMVHAQQRVQLQRNNSFLDVEELRAVCCRSGRSAFLDPVEEDCLVSAGCGGISGALLLGQGVACGVGTASAGPLGKLPQMLAAAALPPPLVVTTGAFGEEQVEEPEPSESDTSCCFEKAWYCLQQVEQEDDEEQSPLSCHNPATASHSRRVSLPTTDAPVSLAKSAVAARAALGVPSRRKSPSPTTSLLLGPAAEAVAPVLAGADDAHATTVAQPLPAPAKAFHHKSGGPCDHCGAKESPQWRRGPAAKPTLCNACGTRYRRTNQLGVPGMKAANANKGAAASANKRSPKRSAAGAGAERPAKRQSKPVAAAGVATTPEVSASVVVEVAQAVELC